MQQLEHTPDAVSILDDLIPLRDASHTEVAEYRVEIPFRNAECFAVLTDGRKVPLSAPWQFKGWSSHEPSRTLLFRVNGAHLEVGIEDELSGKVPGSIHNISIEAIALGCATTMKKFIGIGGEQVLLPA